MNLQRVLLNEDFDGVFSAIITYRQLIEQGIPAKNIRIEGIQYGDTNDEVDRKLSKSKGQMVALVDFARLPEGSSKPDFWSDHHQNEEPESKGGGRTGATEFKSDASHLATLHTNNMVDGKTIDVVNKIDSAGYSNLEEVLKLPKDFRSAGRLERVGILANALLTKSGILKNSSLLEDFIKKTKPSIVSFYNNILEYTKLDKIQKEAIKELEKKDPDWDAVERARGVMPTRKAASEIQGGEKTPTRHRLRATEESVYEDALEDYERLQELKKKGKNRTEEEEEEYKKLVDKDVDEIRSKRAQSIEKAKSSGDLVPQGATILQTNPRLQRYLWTQMNKAGIKYPFVIKRYATFIQVAVNPELPNEVKDKIDLGEIAQDVIQSVKKEFGNKYNEWAFNIIEKESGGHKGITNIAALGTLGLMKKADREELKYLQSLEDRVKKLKQSRKRNMTDEDQERLKEIKKILKRKSTSETDKEYYNKLEKQMNPSLQKIMPNKYERLKELQSKKEASAKKRKKIMDEIIERFQQEFKRRFNASEDVPVMGKNRDVEITGGKPEYEFESTTERIKQIAEYYE